MTEPLRVAIDQLQQRHELLLSDLDAAGFHVLQINRLLGDLADEGVLEPVMILGDVLFDTRLQATTEGRQSHQVLQAAMGLGYGGVGAVVWNAQKFDRQVRQLDSLSEEGVNYVPFERCTPEVRRALLPFLTSLLNCLRERTAQ